MQITLRVLRVLKQASLLNGFLLTQATPTLNGLKEKSQRVAKHQVIISQPFSIHEQQPAQEAGSRILPP